MKTAVYENQLKKMGSTLIPSVDKLIKPAIFFLSGLVLSQFDAIESISPFTYSAVATCPEDMIFSVICGTFTGYLIKGNFLQTLIRYITLSIICTVRILLKGKVQKRHMLVSCVSAAAVPFVCHGVKLLITGFSLPVLIYGICESALSCACCVFFQKLFNLPFVRIGICRLSKRDGALVYGGLFIMVLCLSGIKIGIIRPVHMLAMLAVLLLSHYKELSGGCISGVCLGIALCIQPETRHMLPVLAVSGFFCGILSRTGQTGCSVALCTGTATVYVFSLLSKDCLISLFEAAAVSTVFAFIPQQILMHIESYLDESGYAKKTDEKNSDAAMVIRAASLVEESAQLVNDVFGGLESVSKCAMNGVYADIQQSVCCSCVRKSECWTQHFEATTRMITKIMDGKQPQQLRCINTEGLCKAASRLKKKYNDSLGCETQKEEMRLIAFDGFRLCANLLEDMAHRLAQNRIYDFSKSDMINSYLVQKGIYVSKLVFSTDLDGRSYTEIMTDGEITTALAEKIREYISSAALKKFSSPVISQTDSFIVLEYCQSPVYKISCAYTCYSASDGCECGDSAEYFTDSESNAVCIISDGMGTGCRAAVDGVLASTLIKNLMLAGFSENSILSFVNSALMIKSSDESLATVDILKINVCTGVAAFCKAGAAASYVRMGEEIACINMPSLPAGIIREVSFSKEEIRLVNGNIVLMVSDGAISTGDSWLKEELSAWSTCDMNGLCRHIASLAKKKTEIEHRDDITVAALRITKIK